MARFGIGQGVDATMKVKKFVADLEQADALQAGWYASPADAEETEVLRVHLGAEQFERMHRLAQSTLARAGAGRAEGQRGGDTPASSAAS